MSTFKIIYKIIIGIFFLISFAFILKTLFLNFYPDFKIHYLAPLAIFKDLNPYLGGKGYFTPDVHPPFAILLFSPFTLFSYFLAEKIWTLASVISLIASFILLLKIFNQKIFSVTSALLVSLIFFSFPVKFTLGMGQINFLILFLVTLSIYFSNKNKNYLSGTFLSLSIMIKFFPVLLLPYLIFFKKWKILFSFITVSVIILLFTLIVINPDINIYFYRHVLPTFFGGWKTDYYNQSFSGFLGRQMGNGISRELLKIFISVILLGISFFAVFKKQAEKSLSNMKIGILITLSLIINNFSWQHHFVWLIFPFLQPFSL